jgi:hypothetical protein
MNNPLTYLLGGGGVTPLKINGIAYVYLLLQYTLNIEQKYLFLLLGSVQVQIMKKAGGCTQKNHGQWASTIHYDSTFGKYNSLLRRR